MVRFDIKLNEDAGRLFKKLKGKNNSDKFIKLFLSNEEGKKYKEFESKFNKKCKAYDVLNEKYIRVCELRAQDKEKKKDEGEKNVNEK
jgi:hypothetical protein